MYRCKRRVSKRKTLFGRPDSFPTFDTISRKKKIREIIGILSVETFTRSCIIPLAIFIRKVKIINKLESDILSDRRRISRFIRHWLLGGKITLRLTLDHDVLLIETRRSHVEIVKKRGEREREREGEWRK